MNGLTEGLVCTEISCMYQQAVCRQGCLYFSTVSYQADRLYQQQQQQHGLRAKRPSQQTTAAGSSRRVLCVSSLSDTRACQHQQTAVGRVID